LPSHIQATARNRCFFVDSLTPAFARRCISGWQVNGQYAGLFLYSISMMRRMFWLEMTGEWYYHNTASIAIRFEG